MHLKKIVSLFVIGISTLALGQTDSLPQSISKMNISGPRMGMTGVIDNGTFYNELVKRGGKRIYSQFGWHFEYKSAPVGNAPSFVVEVIPLIGGLEYGLAIPSVSLPIGIRLQNGFEVGMGPNLVFSEKKSEDGSGIQINSSVVFAAGKTFNYYGVGLPVNLAFSNGKGGYALSLIVGYAIAQSREVKSF